MKIEYDFNKLVKETDEEFRGDLIDSMDKASILAADIARRYLIKAGLERFLKDLGTGKNLFISPGAIQFIGIVYDASYKVALRYLDNNGKK